MSDQLYDYYVRELRFIRAMGAEFAAAHPNEAGDLRIDGERFEDPHVRRLIQSFALLNARTRRKLDDEFPELTDALLGVLYPHYSAPIPSTAIVQFVLDRQQGSLTEGYTIERGAALETVPSAEVVETCLFRTCYSVDLWPIRMAAAVLKGPPFTGPQTPYTAAATTVLRIELECLDSAISFSELALDRLRFYLSDQPPHVYDLYELLLNNTLGIAVAASPTDEQCVLLDKEDVRAVGFDRDEGLLDYPAQALAGYRLLTEYFAFAEKFLFFDVCGLRGRPLERVRNKLYLYFYFDRHVAELDRNVSKDSFQLGCSPVVNLFAKSAEPIEITYTEHEYRVIPDERRQDAHEVYAIHRVVATSPDNEEVEFQPFYSFRHGVAPQEQRTFWHTSRRPRGYADGVADRGTEVYLALVDLDFEPSRPADWTLYVQTTCLNRDLPHGLPFGGGEPNLQLPDGGPLEAINCLTRPTPTRRPALRRGALWRLISHLSLNHLSLTDFEEGADVLREILKLYDFANSPETQNAIDGILSVRNRPTVQRIQRKDSSAVCRGVEVTIEFDESKFSGTGAFLLASVLNRFLGLYSSINSFTTLIATSKQREEKIRQWNPRAGESPLL